MKKIILSVFILALFTLSACSKKSDNITSTSSTKESSQQVIESTEKNHQDLNSIVSNLTTDENKSIAESFSKAGLTMYSAKTDGPVEMAPIPDGNPANRPVYSSGMSFYSHDEEYSFIIYIENYSSIEELNDAEIYVKDNAVDELLITRNDSILSLLFAYPGITDQSTKEEDINVFEEYKDIFEKIK